MISPLLDQTMVITVPRVWPFTGTLTSLPTLRRGRTLSYLCSWVLTVFLINLLQTGFSFQPSVVRHVAAYLLA